MTEEGRTEVILEFEADAELLFVQHLDLLAQLEAQLRAVHHTMRRIERLRGGSRRIGPELVNGERETILSGLAKEVDELDRHIAVEHHCCLDLHTTILGMQQRVATLKRLAARLHEMREAPTPGDAGEGS
jgi:hypothetical protein